MQNIHKNETSISILYINTNFRQNFTFSKQTITASYERKAAIYALLFSFRKHRNSSCHLERVVPGQPDPLTLEHGYENCMHANEYEFSTETKRS